MKPIKFCLLLLTATLLAACGQPGPLYLPVEAPPIKVTPKPKNTPPADKQPEDKTPTDTKQ